MTMDPARRRGLSRRSFLRASAAGAGALGATSLAGCGGVAAGGGPQLAYWNFFTGGDGGRMVDLIDSYRAEAPDVDVTATTLEWGSPYYTKLAMAVEGGRGPDLATLHASRLETFGLNLVDSWDLGELEARGVTLDQFPQPALERVTLDGELKALPLDTHPLVLFYNTRICEEAGLLASDGSLAPLDSAEAFLDAGRRAAEVTGDNGIAYGTNDALASFMLFWSVFNQLGGQMVFPDGSASTSVEVDRDAMVSAMDFIATMCDDTIASRSQDGAGAPAAFASEQAGFLLIGPWEVATAQTAGIPFSMTQFPALYGDTAYCRADSHSFVLPTQASTDPETRGLAYDMAVALLRNSLSWAEGGHIPALSEVAESPEYLALDPQSNYRGAADVAAFDPEIYFAGSGSTFMSRAGQSLQGVGTGALTPEQGADDLIGWIDDQLALGSPL
ncbi:extracellular solute-binding protein [Pseudokineococcus marinus]|uniref:Extracellular solute-binding protein n=1 Tax=Pseudokineococcus marinus TaxID=351215 RepID=A0A849BNL0_9ACTN|nr:extracellular solute-binding protein [Pseudokineococcus marinus]NNH22174.1 extracellular solute-binding protein [Pseudokineococcus marinus]